jgi:hypothetical protein
MFGLQNSVDSISGLLGEVAVGFIAARRREKNGMVTD